MSDSESTAHVAVPELPASAPQVRITAGIGSPAQKTWNLRRPVTLVGSKRPAAIVIHDGEVSKAHCVIINTGTEVLLKDLHTPGGTLRNKDRVDLAVLADGDVVTIGNMRLQIAIRIPTDVNGDSAGGIKFVDPTRFPQPIRLGLEHTDTKWCVEEAVALIGRHDDALVRLDHADVSERHAILFRFGRQSAIFDLGSRKGLSLNGDKGVTFVLNDGDHAGFGPFTLVVNPAPCSPPGVVSNPVLSNPMGSASVRPMLPGPAKVAVTPKQPNAGQPSALPDQPIVSEPAASKKVLPARNGSNHNGTAAGTPATTGSPMVDVPATHQDDDPTSALTRIETDLADLQNNISGSWDRLNTWDSRVQRDTSTLGKRQSDLNNRSAELDARDAALRGQLHDLTQYQEQISLREQELAQQLARIQEEQDKLTQAKQSFSQRDQELVKKHEELQRREHALSQRWTRVMTAKCPHCGKRLNG